MSKLGRTSFVTVGLTVGVVTLLATNGCSEAQKALDSACCKDFQVGADMSAVNWENSDPGVEANFGALVQGVGDFSALTAATANDVAGSCRSIAIALDPTTADDPTVNVDGGGILVEAWCNLAVKAIGTAKAAIKADATFKAVVEPPKCEAEVNFQAKCDAKCNVDVSVDCEAELGNISARCEPGQLSGSCSGECSGSCTGSASVDVKCEGSCTGQCSGECTGTASAAVDCAGSCSATCNGNCTVGATTTKVNGACAGTCEGSCTGSCKLNAGAKVSCNGSCKGSCDATCTAAGNAKVSCNGSCKGSCNVEFKEPKCEVALKPPSASCQGKASADCNANCQASANARANCSPPRVAVTLEGAIGLDAAGQAKLDNLLRVLESNLPNVATVFSARFAQITTLGAKLATQAGGIAASGSLSVKSVGCGIQVSGAITPAVANLNATLKAANAISTAIKLG